MINYKEEVVTGDFASWVRARKIVIENPYGQIPYLTIQEERLATTPDGDILTLPLNVVANITETTDDLSKEINLINPIDGTSMGVVSYGYLQVILYSLYLQLATARDTIVPDEPIV